jgi:hypothetical protein
MCRELKFNGLLIGGLGGLRRAVGAENVVFWGDGPADPIPDDTCLCVVDLEETARRAGMDCRWDDELGRMEMAR